MACSVVNCNERPSKDTETSFFHFPKDKKVCRRWITAIKRAKWEPSAYSRVCSKHFTVDDLDPTSPCRIKLKIDAVPSVFLPSRSGEGEIKRLKKTAVPSQRLPTSGVCKSPSTVEKAASKARKIRCARRRSRMAESCQKITDPHTDFRDVDSFECSSSYVDTSLESANIPAMNSTDVTNVCLRELIYTSQLPVIFSESLDWDVLKWTLEDWSKAFQSRLFEFRCGAKKCQKSPTWESQCETEYHTFEELIKFSKDEAPIKNRWWYFDYKTICENSDLIGDIFKTVSWKGLGFPEKRVEDSTIWIGSPGAHTPCHFDSYGCNVVAQVFGKKRWILFPPSETDNLKPTRVPYEESSVYSSINFSCSQQLKKNLQFNQCYVVDMNAGDVLLIPPKWWHYVENVTLAISVNMWIPVKEDDINRLDEALVRYLISSLTCNAAEDLKKLILNPNELDLKEGFINLQIIEQCRKMIERAEEISVTETTTELYNLVAHSHKYKVIRPISIFEFNRILPNCLNSHTAAEEWLAEDHVDTLTSVINAFCHPDIVRQIRDKFLT